jgi:arsenate reductase-like glutaredoxin family protein
MTCQKAREFLGQHHVTATETVDARRERYDEEDALKLLDDVEKLVAARGKSTEVLDLKEDRPTKDVLLAHLLGPTGNLRAPTARVGKTLVVGFNEDAYKQVLGA